MRSASRISVRASGSTGTAGLSQYVRIGARGPLGTSDDMLALGEGSILQPSVEMRRHSRHRNYPAFHAKNLMRCINPLDRVIYKDLLQAEQKTIIFSFLSTGTSFVKGSRLLFNKKRPALSNPK